MMRAFVLTEPYGPLDFTICDTVTQAVEEVARLRAEGKNTRLIETSGTMGDLRPLQRSLRAEYVEHLAQTLPVATAATEVAS